MENNKPLSEKKLMWADNIEREPYQWFKEKDVTEAVQRLKEICDRGHNLEYPAQKKHFLKLIDEIFGELK